MTTVIRLAAALYAAFIAAACGHTDATPPIEEEIVSPAPQFETFSDFVMLFPEGQVPFALQDSSSSFDPGQYPLLPDTLVDRFMEFEPWAWRDNDTLSFYGVSAFKNSDSTHLILYLITDSLPHWSIRQMTLANVTNRGKLLGRQMVAQHAEAQNYHTLGEVEILQTMGLTHLDSGYLKIQTVTSQEGLRKEKYTFAIDHLGEIDSEFVIKEQ